ncbi:MAG TPA: bifunctional sulfate adenylyltransferase/adenylylsulfate kinase [Candidatus Saccharimonadales bacterium]|nr:bifunctional sulfate adenylyltransferase/adenylylsulfate kinase [Candidatus Saccharimonadales bacterium]
MENSSAPHFDEPHGNELVNLLVSKQEAEDLKKQSANFKSWNLTPRQICDVEMLLNGGFSPLMGFMGKDDYTSVCKNMRLKNGVLWPIPITLDVNAEFAKSLNKGEKIALRDLEGVILAILEVRDKWKPDKTQEAKLVFGAGCDDTAHPAINYLYNQAGEYYVGGKLIGLELPTHYDFTEHRYTPEELRQHFKKLGWNRIVAFQTRNPMHRAHVELVLRAASQTQANVLINPSVGMTKPGDVDHYTRMRVYQEIIKKLPKSRAMISMLPVAMRMGGPREVLWHMIIRKNYGATHFIVGRDHAGPGNRSDGNPFYEPYDAQEIAEKYAQELGIEVVPFQMMVYAPKHDAYMPIDDITKGTEYKSISGTELRARLAEGRELPEWFTYPEVAAELQRTYNPRHKQGVTIFFTGLSGAGKSTIANALMVKLLEHGGRSVTLLDGDVVRKHLSSELGFSKEHRNLNINRIGFVASEIAKHGGIALCAPIAPYDASRKQARRMVTDNGGRFVLVHVATPVEECEKRDRKGLYAAAKTGKIKGFTGVSSPYEEPADAELTLDTLNYSADKLADQVLRYLKQEGYLLGTTILEE